MCKEKIVDKFMKDKKISKNYRSLSFTLGE